MASFGREMAKLDAKNGTTSFTYFIEPESAVGILLTESKTRRRFAFAATKHFDAHETLSSTRLVDINQLTNTRALHKRDVPIRFPEFSQKNDGGAIRMQQQ